MTSASSTQPHSATTKTPHISNPRRLLIVSPESHSLSTIPDLLHSLTGVPIGDIPRATSPSTPTSTATPADPSRTPPTSTTTTTDTATATQESDIPSRSTFAGYTTHPPLQLRTKYYNADVPIWVDEIPLPGSSTSSTIPSDSNTSTPTASASQWKTEFLGPEARIVRDVIGAVIVCLRNPGSNPVPMSVPSAVEDPAGREDVKAVKDVVRVIGEVKERVEEERDGGGDVPGLLVLVEKDGRVKRRPSRRADDEDEDGLGEEEAEPFSTGWWEDQLFDMGLMGFEVVTWDPKVGEEAEDKRNQFGEYQGMRRIREVLETHEWADSSDAHDTGDILDDDLEAELLGLDTGDSGFNLEVNELEREMLGLRMVIGRGHGEDDSNDHDHDDETQVESLEALMLRMQAIRDMSAELPESERKKFAAKAVRDIMKEL